jgi:hypothetical protein
MSVENSSETVFFDSHGYRISDKVITNSKITLDPQAVVSFTVVTRTIYEGLSLFPKWYQIFIAQVKRSLLWLMALAFIAAIFYTRDTETGLEAGFLSFAIAFTLDYLCFKKQDSTYIYVQITDGRNIPFFYYATTKPYYWYGVRCTESQHWASLEAPIRRALQETIASKKSLIGKNQPHNYPRVSA